MRNATFYDPSWEDSQSQAMPYGHGGPAATSGTNAGFIRDSRVCSGLRDDEETWAGEDECVVPLPSISQARAALTMTPGNSVRCNTSRQTTAAECSRSPVLSAGSRHAGITVRSLLLDPSEHAGMALVIHQQIAVQVAHAAQNLREFAWREPECLLEQNRVEVFHALNRTHCT